MSMHGCETYILTSNMQHFLSLSKSNLLNFYDSFFHFIYLPIALYN